MRGSIARHCRLLLKDDLHVASTNILLISLLPGCPSEYVRSSIASYHYYFLH